MSGEKHELSAMVNQPFYPDWEGRRATKSIFSAVAGGLWLVALALPAYTDDTPGFFAFILGWMMLFDGHGLGFIGWFANFPFIVGVFMFMLGRRTNVIRAALILSIVAAVFSLAALAVDEVPSYGGSDSVTPYIGCFTYVFAMLIFMAGNIVYYTKHSMTLSRHQ